MSGAGYQSLGDVETATTTTAGNHDSDSYADLKPDQAALLKQMDKTIRKDSEYEFKLPPVDASEVAVGASGFCPSVMALTVVLMVVVVGGAILPNQQEKYPFLAIILAYYPYACAILLYLASMIAIFGRFKAASAPVLAKMESVEGTVKEQVSKIADNVDTKISSLHDDIDKVMKPVKQTLAKAAKQASTLKKLDPKVDIPTYPRDITQEFDSMTGQMDAKVNDVQEHISVKHVIPGSLKSFGALFCQMVFPFLLIGLLLQLTVAWACETYVVTPALATATVQVPLSRYLRGSPSGNTVLKVDSLFQGYVLSPPLHNGLGAPVDVVGNHHYHYRRRLDDSRVSEIELEVKTSTIGVEKELVSDAQQYQTLILSAVALYIMAFLQLCVAYILTSASVQARKVNGGLQTVSDETNRTLRAHGVTNTLQDVLGVRLGRIRTKILQVLRSVDKIEGLLGKVPSVTTGAEDAKNKTDKSKSKSGKKKSFLGKLFS